MFIFPWSNLHELNLDWILSKMKHLLETEEENNEKADYAVETAEEAKTIAEQAAQAQIGDGAVTTVKLADEAVTTAKIDDEAITTAKIDDGAITTAKINDEAITTAKIDDEAVTKGKLSPAVQETLDFVTSDACLFLCDSYGTGSGGGLSTTPFCDIVASKLGLVADSTYFKVARGGAAFGYNSGTPSDPDTGLNFYDLLAYAINHMTAAQRAQIKYVIICGGINDYQYSYDNIAAGVANTRLLLDTYFPNASYKFACIGMSLNPSIRTSYIQNTIAYLFDACTGQNITFGTCFTPLNYNKNTMFHTDGTHPTQAGQNALARYVFNFLSGYNCYESNTYFTFDTPLGAGLLQFSGNHLICTFTPTQKIYDTAINIPATWTDLGAISSYIIVGNTSSNATSFLVTGSIRAGGTWYNQAYIECKFVQVDYSTVHLYARSVYYITGTNTYNPYNSVTNFLPAPVTFFIPLKG